MHEYKVLVHGTVHYEAIMVYSFITEHCQEAISVTVKCLSVTVKCLSVYVNIYFQDG